jgi:hypothetical protein
MLLADKEIRPPSNDFPHAAPRKATQFLSLSVIDIMPILVRVNISNLVLLGKPVIYQEHRQQTNQ